MTCAWHRLVFAWVALAIVLASMGALLAQSRSLWVPAAQDLLLAMRYGVSGRARYGRHEDDTDQLGLIRLEVVGGPGGPGKGPPRGAPDLAAPPGNCAGDAGGADSLEPRPNGRAGETHGGGSERSVSDGDSPGGRHVQRAGRGGNATAGEPTFVASFPNEESHAPGGGK